MSLLNFSFKNGRFHKIAIIFIKTNTPTKMSKDLNTILAGKTDPKNAKIGNNKVQIQRVFLLKINSHDLKAKNTYETKTPSPKLNDKNVTIGAANLPKTVSYAAITICVLTSPLIEMPLKTITNTKNE